MRPWSRHEAPRTKRGDNDQILERGKWHQPLVRSTDNAREPRRDDQLELFRTDVLMMDRESCSSTHYLLFSDQMLRSFTSRTKRSTDQTYRSSLLLRARACERRRHQHPLHPDGEPASRHRHQIPKQAAPSLLDQQHREIQKLILVFRKYLGDLFRRLHVDRLFCVYILTTAGDA